MKLINEDLLQHFREKRQCEHCGRKLKLLAHPHHLWCRGLGGGERLDHPWNLIALGAAFECNCHGLFHDGNLLHETLLAIVAAREGVLQDQIEREIARLRRLPKRTDPSMYEPDKNDPRIGKRCVPRSGDHKLHGATGVVFAVYPDGTAGIDDPAGVLHIKIVSKEASGRCCMEAAGKWVTA